MDKRRDWTRVFGISKSKDYGPFLIPAWGEWTKKESGKRESGQKRRLEKRESGQEYLVFLKLKITALFLSQLGESGQGYLATGGGPTSLLCQHKMIDWLVWITGLTRNDETNFMKWVKK